MTEQRGSTAHIYVTSKFGKGWRGDLPKANGPRVTIEPKPETLTSESLGYLATHKTYANMGCDDAVLAGIDLTGFREVKPQTDDFVQDISVVANRVFLCGSVGGEDSFTVLTDQLTMRNVNLERAGGTEKFVKFVARSVELHGVNKITSTGVDGPITTSDGPAISVTAEKLNGSGKLFIHSQGANYKPQAREKQP